MEDLARRAVACHAWRWLPGCPTTKGAIILSVHGDGTARAFSNCGVRFWTAHTLAKALPDIDAAPTIGCLLHLVRKAWGEQVWIQQCPGGSWTCWWLPDAEHGAVPCCCATHSESEAEALVAALEAAPDQRTKGNT